MDKYSLIINKKKWPFKDMIEYVSKLYYGDMPDGNVLELSYINAMIANKINQGIDSEDIVEGVVGEFRIVPAPDEPDGVEEYFHIDYDMSYLSTSEVRGYLRTMVTDGKFDAPDEFKQKFLGMELSESVTEINVLESPPTEQVEQMSVPNCIFKKNNQSWYVKFYDSKLEGVKDLVGMSYIHLLLQSPLEPIGVIELQSLMNGHQVKPGCYADSADNGNERGTSTSSKPRAAKGSQSLNKLKEHLQKIAVDRADAERNQDFVTQESLDIEAEQIQEQIDLIQYGRSEKDPELEKNRKKIAKNIKDALENIQKQEIAVG
jgi:hypothetical protein